MASLFPPPKKAKSVTHVSGTFCYLCLGTVKTHHYVNSGTRRAEVFMQDSVYSFMTLNRDSVRSSWDLDVSCTSDTGCERLPNHRRKDNIVRGAYYQCRNTR